MKFLVSIFLCLLFYLPITLENEFDEKTFETDINLPHNWRLESPRFFPDGTTILSGIRDPIAIPHHYEGFLIFFTNGSHHIADSRSLTFPNNLLGLYPLG